MSQEKGFVTLDELLKKPEEEEAPVKKKKRKKKSHRRKFREVQEKINKRLQQKRRIIR